MQDGERGPENEYPIHQPPHPLAHGTGKSPIRYQFNSALGPYHEGYRLVSQNFSAATARLK